MQDLVALEAARNLTFQKIGRNMVELQKMEVLLKFLLLVSGIRALPEDLKETIAKRRKQIGRMTLGELAGKWSEFVSSGPAQQSIPEFEEALVRYSIKFEDSADFWAAWLERLEKTVDERNGLVHKILHSFRPNAIDSCDATSAALDQQYSNFRPLLTWLQEFAKQIRASFAAALVELDEEELPDKT